MSPKYLPLLFALLLDFSSTEVIAQSGKSGLKTLQKCLVGDFSSQEQSQRDSDYFDIRLHIRPIWTSDKGNRWLYVEQAAAKKKEKPYRQRIYHLTQQDDSTIIRTASTLDSMHLFMGAYQDIARFQGMKPKDAKPLPGCDLVLHWRNGHFVGSTDGAKCKNAWGKATYATSEVDIGPDGMVSWDRGYDDTGTQVWGAEGGGYHFVKRP